MGLKVLFVAAEAAPFIKVGGLGDVMGGLPKQLVNKGIDARVIIPLYSAIEGDFRAKMKFLTSTMVSVGWRKLHVGIFEMIQDGVTYYFIDNEQYFKRQNVYGEFDDGERFAFFSKAVLEAIEHIRFYPDVINANDWHTALVPVYLDVFYRNNQKYKNIKTVLSIHNIEFQGKYDPYILGDVFGLDVIHKSLLLYDGCLNILKGGIERANAVNTVSKTYAQEILHQPHSYGLECILNARSYKLSGIVNGIDTQLFNPFTDNKLPYNYSYDNIRNKTLVKKHLQKEMRLNQKNVPMLAMITRLTPQKGIDLVQEVIGEIAKMDVQFLLLGTGYGEYENALRKWENDYKDKVRGIVMFSSRLATMLYGASDMLLMPSKSEPCGLAQMIAMRYGSVPIVHTVGGLKDTVLPFDITTKLGNGITFQSYDPYDMLDAIKRGIDLYQNKQIWRILRKNAMTTDFSWDKPSEQYIKLYESVLSV